MMYTLQNFSPTSKDMCLFMMLSLLFSLFTFISLLISIFWKVL